MLEDSVMVRAPAQLRQNNTGVASGGDARITGSSPTLFGRSVRAL
jgi:hypothetical protein